MESGHTKQRYWQKAALMSNSDSQQSIPKRAWMCVWMLESDGNGAKEGAEGADSNGSSIFRPPTLECRVRQRHNTSIHRQESQLTILSAVMWSGTDIPPHFSTPRPVKRRLIAERTVASFQVEAGCEASETMRRKVKVESEGRHWWLKGNSTVTSFSSQSVSRWKSVKKRFNICDRIQPRCAYRHCAASCSSQNSGLIHRQTSFLFVSSCSCLLLSFLGPFSFSFAVCLNESLRRRHTLSPGRARPHCDQASAVQSVVQSKQTSKNYSSCLIPFLTLLSTNAGDSTRRSCDKNENWSMRRSRLKPEVEFKENITRITFSVKKVGM